MKDEELEDLAEVEKRVDENSGVEEISEEEARQLINEGVPLSSESNE